jgi:hypothetical protein
VVERSVIRGSGAGIVACDASAARSYSTIVKVAVTCASLS